MSDQYKNLVANQEEQISLLTKALEREKMARQQLEAKVSQINEKQFEATREILSSYETTRIRQIQLQFLAFMSREQIENKTVSELSKFFIENILQLLGQNTAVCFQLKNDKIQKTIYINEVENDWQNLSLKQDELLQVSSLIPQENSKWQRYTLTKNYHNIFPFMNAPLVLAIKVPKQKGLDEIILINIEHYCYSDDFKHTLDIAANQFTGIIQKRSTEQMLSQNYKKLKQTLQLLKTTQQQLTHNEKMVSLGQLSAGVAHEINNPLSFLSSNLETLKDYIVQYDKVIEHGKSSGINFNDVIEDEQLQFIQEDSEEILDACLNGVSRMAEIVNNLKLFSKKDNDEFSATDLVEVIDASLAIVANKLKCEHKVELEHSQEQLIINGNFGQLQQVIVNLLINAIDAMNEKGSLKVKTLLNNDEAIISIKDDGIGMSNEIQNRIFDPFYSTKSESNGTGLGLSVSYAIITKHNAAIKVYSEVNIGTTFILKFPLLSAHNTLENSDKETILI